MLRNTEFIRSHQLMLRQFSGGIVHRFVKREEFCELMLSRRPLERCNHEPAQHRGLFDLRTGELFAIREWDLFAQA